MILLIGLWGCGGSATKAVPEVTPAAPSEPTTDLSSFPGTRIFEGDDPVAAVVMLHGSEGGRAMYTEAFARVFAERGFVTASFCWYDCEGLPEAVHEVSLDRTVEFLEWFSKGPAAGLPVTLYGGSRGAEQALLLASLLEDDELVAGVVSHAGSDTVVAAFDRRSGDVVREDDGFAAAWTWHGEPLYGERAMPYGSGPVIHIERYAGPVLLSHGAEDPLWPAERSRRLAARREKAPTLETELVVWEGEGHVLSSNESRAKFVSRLDSFARARAAMR